MSVADQLLLAMYRGTPRGVQIVLVGPEMLTRLKTARGDIWGGDIWVPGGKHTREEAERVIHARIPEFTIVTSAYHQLRAFLTFVKAASDAGWKPRMWNLSAPSSMERVADEMRRIAEYQAKGHVASFEEGLSYCAWRDNHLADAA